MIFHLEREDAAGVSLGALLAPSPAFEHDALDTLVVAEIAR